MKTVNRLWVWLGLGLWVGMKTREMGKDEIKELDKSTPKMKTTKLIKERSTKLSNGKNLKRNTTTTNLNYKRNMKLHTKMKAKSND